MPRIADTLSFHIVARGCAFIEVDGAEAVRLNAGHLALVPRGMGIEFNCLARCWDSDSFRRRCW